MAQRAIASQWQCLDSYSWVKRGRCTHNCEDTSKATSRYPLYCCGSLPALSPVPGEGLLLLNPCLVLHRLQSFRLSREEGGLEKQLNWPEILSEVIIALDFESDTEIKSGSSGLAFSFPFRHYQGARELSFLGCQKNLESEVPNLFKTQAGLQICTPYLFFS